MSVNANTAKLRLWLLLFMAFLMPFKIKGAAFLPAVYLIFWLFSGGYKGTKVLNSRHPALWLIILFYVYHLVGLIWTENISDGLFDLQVKFSLLFFPALFMLSPGFERTDLQKIIRWFISGNAIALACCLVRAAFSEDPYGFFYVSFSWFMHPGYFSMYLCYCIAVILYDVIYNSSDNLFPKRLSMFLIAFFIAGVLLLSSKTGLFLVLCILSWYVYLQFISGSGVRAAIMISGLIAGIVVLSETTPYIHDRLHEIKMAFSETSVDGDPHSSIMRFQVWRSALAIITQDPLLGTGTGDVKDELVKYYRQHGYDRVADNELNSHNQFLQSFAALGIVGFLLLIGFFVAGYFDARRNGNVMLKWLLLILFVFGLFESVIEVQAGVMFAGLFIPLLFQWKPDAEALQRRVSDQGTPIFTRIREYAAQHPLRFALGIGFAIRLVAVLFSKGFGMHDDHFLVIEASSAWADGTDYDSWLPAHGGVRPDGHSFFYSGLHFIFFHILKFIGIHDPQVKMFFVRLVHALLSLGTIYFGYRITRKISDEKSAAIVALLLAVLWFMPWLSVRNLVEVACIPFLIWGTWMMIRSEEPGSVHRNFLYAGMLFGIAFSIRFQTVLFIGGAGLALLWLRRVKDAVYLGIGTLIVFTATQAPVDYVIWGAPFAQFGEYVRYNLDNAYNYIVGPWYNYTLLILGILIPPISLFLFFGFVRNWKKHIMIFLPVLVFLAFHSYFPNKQERFILPIVPFFVIMGIPGWRDWLASRSISGIWKKVISVSWAFFWTINILLLPFITTMYSKRARVESMTYLYPKRSTIASLIMEDTNRSSAKMAPEFYLGKWIFTYDLSQASGYDSLEFYMNKMGPDYYPQYALFLGDKNLDERVMQLKKYFPEMSLETTIDPGFVDKVLYWLNPRNANDVIFIYSTGIPPAKQPEEPVTIQSSS